MRAQPFPIIVAIGLSLAVAGAGCALTTKADSVLFRYFSPEGAATPAPHSSGEAGGRGLEVRIGRVEAVAYLKDRIVFRESPQEIRYYDRLRWSESRGASVGLEARACRGCTCARKDRVRNQTDPESENRGTDGDREEERSRTRP